MNLLLSAALQMHTSMLDIQPKLETAAKLPFQCKLGLGYDLDLPSIGDNSGFTLATLGNLFAGSDRSS